MRQMIDMAMKIENDFFSFSCFKLQQPDTPTSISLSLSISSALWTLEVNWIINKNVVLIEFVCLSLGLMQTLV